MTGVKLGHGFKLSKDGKKIEVDHKARDARLDVSARIAKRKSNRIRVVSHRKQPKEFKL